MLSSCKAYLQQLAELGSLVGDFYLLLGHEFEPAALPSDLRRGVPKQCYANAGNLALGRPDLVYCEGFALKAGLFPMHHAWCVDPCGRVVDPTWEHPEANQYLGVALSSRFLMEHLDETGVWGILAEQVPPSIARGHPGTYLHPDWFPSAEQVTTYLAKVLR